jgi:L-alanine-DL-glutamate epimerase-like enolase superfamily enzyme
METERIRLAAAEAIPYSLPFREPYVTARGTIGAREMVLFRIRDSDGVAGLGEAVPLSLRGVAPTEQVVRELRALAEGPDLAAALAAGRVGEGAWLSPDLGLSPPARCAALTALLDLGERRAGACFNVDPVPCNATLVAGEPAAVAEQALGWAAEGYTTFKLKLGAGDDVGQVRAVREALGPDALIRVDANASWDLDTAATILGALEPLGIQLAEQPVATMERAAELAGLTSIPLAGDESVETPEDALRAARTGAFQLTGIKLSKVGGLHAGRRIAGNLPAYVSSALDGPVGIAAGARLAAKLAPLPWPVAGERAHGLATQRLFAETVAAVGCELRGGRLRLPSGPGLGVEIDEDALRAHRL